MRPELSEEAIHKQIIDYCRWAVKPSVIYWHTGNGGKRHITTARKMKAMGQLAGVPDLIFMYGTQYAPRMLFVEIKSEAGKLSDAQVAFKEACKFPFKIVQSLEDFEQLAKDFGLIKGSENEQ